MAQHDGAIEREWADGAHCFRLPIAQLLELQEKCDAGPVEIFSRLRAQTWRLNDLRETIRLGLIGGGTPPMDALTLVKRYVDPPRPLLENVPLALEILEAALTGPPEDLPGKARATEEMDASPPSPFLEPAPSSGSPLPTSEP